MTKTLKVKAIKNGTVIDHIPAGRVNQIIEHLEKDDKNPIMMGVNLKSKRLGRKDILKIENKELTPEEVSRVAVIAPEATVNIIRNYENVKKIKVKIPEEIVKILKCPNPNCVTNHASTPTIFHPLCEKPLKVKCYYCERMFEGGEIALK